jgi:hypothetical protein
MQGVEVRILKYFWTIFWTFLLVLMLSYVAGSMVGVAFDFQTAAILGIVTSILLFILPAILPNDGDEQGSH